MRTALSRRRIETFVAALVAIAAAIVGIATQEGRTLGPKFVTLERIARLREPVYLTQPPGQGSQLYVVQKRGAVRIIANDHLLTRPFLDIHRLVKHERRPAATRDGLDRLPARLRPDGPLLRLLQRPPGRPAGGRVPPQRGQPAGGGSELPPPGPQHPGADPGASRRADRLRPGRLPLYRHRGRRAGRGSRPERAEPRPPARQDPADRSSAHAAAGGTRRVHDPAGQPVRRQARPGRDLGLRPAQSPALLVRPRRPRRSRSATSATTATRRSTTCPSTRSRGANFGWPAYEGFAAFRGGLPRSATILPGARLSAPSAAAR